MGEWRYNSTQFHSPQHIETDVESHVPVTFPFCPRERATGTHWMGRLLSHGGRPDNVEKRTIRILSRAVFWETRSLFESKDVSEERITSIFSVE
jgi:hypothetical protein